MVKNHVLWCIWVTYTLCIWFQSLLDTFFLKSFKNGPFLAKLKMFRGGFHHVPHLAPKYPLEFKKKNTNRKKYSLTPVLPRAVQGVKLPILSKKCIFRAENVIFLKSSFYTKFISDPKYSFSVGQKQFFVVQSKVSIFHQILPTHNTICCEKLIFGVCFKCFNSTLVSK